jgi:hypothetical protein
MAGTVIGAVIIAVCAGVTIGMLRGTARHYAGRHRYRQDVRQVTHQVCASCGGNATSLRYDDNTDSWLCKDRELCRSMLIYKSMLDSVE